MLDFNDITSQYPQSLQGFKRNMLREYLQYKILAVISNSPYSTKLSFIGGTALCIVHHNPRFSEDLDFDNFDLMENEFDTLAEFIQKKLQSEGYDVEIRNVHKGAYRCYMRFPKILFDLGLTQIEEEKVLIQIDTAPHHFKYEPETKILNKFDVFASIRVTPLDVLLSQKFNAAFSRKTAKGRDFYDIVFLLSRTKPNYDYLREKLGISDENDLRKKFLQKINSLNFVELAEDVKPFLFKPDDNQKVLLFPEFFKEVKL